MKPLNWVVLAGLAGLVLLAVVLTPSEQGGLLAPASIESQPLEAELSDERAASVPSALERPASTRPAAAAPLAPKVETLVSKSGGASVAVVRVEPRQILAAVNGVPIMLNDLIPLPAEKVGLKQIMSAEMYRFLLNRAVERELVSQAARQQGVELTAVQLQRLADLRAQSEQREPGVFDTVQHNPANVEFEQRDAAGLLLQAKLAERAGVAAPHVTAAHVRDYYQQHSEEFGALPADPAQRQSAWEKIDQAIRQRLAPRLQAEHQAGFQRFVEQLKTTAAIEIPTL